MCLCLFSAPELLETLMGLEEAAKKGLKRALCCCAHEDHCVAMNVISRVHKPYPSLPTVFHAFLRLRLAEKSYLQWLLAGVLCFMQEKRGQITRLTLVAISLDKQ